MHASVSASRRMGWINRVPAGEILRLVPAGDREDDNHEAQPSGSAPAEREDLPYKVEIWNKSGAAVEQVVAVTANASIGYAAYVVLYHRKLYAEGTGGHGQKSKNQPPRSGRKTGDRRWRQAGRHVRHCCRGSRCNGDL
jgi:hypothetical protein